MHPYEHSDNSISGNTRARLQRLNIHDCTCHSETRRLQAQLRLDWGHEVQLKNWVVLARKGGGGVLEMY